jgi:hypothetical protein
VVNEDHSAFEWEFNNWSCDCNRVLLFGSDADDRRCANLRYVVVEADNGGDIGLMNEGYPEELRQLAREWRLAHG